MSLGPIFDAPYYAVIFSSTQRYAKYTFRIAKVEHNYDFHLP